MAELLTLARPYAKAAFAFAGEKGILDHWSKMLQKFAAMIQDDAFSAYINRPEFTPDLQIQILQGIGDARIGGPYIERFLLMLAQNGRLSLLPEIALEFEQLKAQNQNQVDVVIESAFPLTEEQKQLLADRLAKRFNSTVNATVEVNPALIGGVVIHAGDQVIDDSVRNKLEKMRTRLTA